MIAALDGTPLTLTSGGLRRYTEELFRALQAEFPADQYHLLSDQLLTRKTRLDRHWWSLGLPRALSRLRCDVFHGTDYAVPYLPLRPSVMSVHDISPWMDRTWHTGADRVRRRTPILIRLGLATMLITGTEAVRRQVIELFRIARERVAVVPYAPAEHLRPVPVTAGSEPYFLFVGTIEPRKNVPALLEAFREVRQRHPVRLVIAGRRREDGPVIDDQPGVSVQGEVTEDQLAALYSGALALVYPSLYEGFGLPVAEAMRCGAPVITSMDPSVTEVSGGAALHVDSTGLVSAMESMITEPELRLRLRDRSLARATHFSWKRTARMTRDVYIEAIGRFRRNV